MPPPFAPRKLLVAAVGVATVNLACGRPPTAGNLAVAPGPDADPATVDASTTAPEPMPLPPTAGNLMMPRPPEEPQLPTPPDAGAPAKDAGAPAKDAGAPAKTRDAGAPRAPRPPRPPTAGNLMAPTTGNLMLREPAPDDPKGTK